jgi:hypothetical protein
MFRYSHILPEPLLSPVIANNLIPEIRKPFNQVQSGNGSTIPHSCEIPSSRDRPIKIIDNRTNTFTGITTKLSTQLTSLARSLISIACEANLYFNAVRETVTVSNLETFKLSL